MRLMLYYSEYRDSVLVHLHSEAKRSGRMAYSSARQGSFRLAV